MIFIQNALLVYLVDIFTPPSQELFEEENYNRKEKI
jgi:hypothetical protein